MISVGRYNGNDIRLEDNAISRIHSALTLKDNKLLIKDMSSKFGTGIYYKIIIYLFVIKIL